MKKTFLKIFAVVMTAALMISAVPALAVDSIAVEKDFRVVYNLETGESYVVDMNSTEEDIVTVYVSISEAEDTLVEEVYTASGLTGRYLKGTITYTIVDTVTWITYINKVSCYYSQYIDSSTSTTIDYSYVWDFLRTTGSTMTMYDKGYATYTNGLLTYRNRLAIANWGVTSGTYAIASNFYTYNPEYFGGSSAMVATFVYD